MLLNCSYFASPTILTAPSVCKLFSAKYIYLFKTIVLHDKTIERSSIASKRSIFEISSTVKDEIFLKAPITLVVTTVCNLLRHGFCILPKHLQF